MHPSLRKARAVECQFYPVYVEAICPRMIPGFSITDLCDIAAGNEKYFYKIYVPLDFDKCQELEWMNK